MKNEGFTAFYFILMFCIDIHLILTSTDNHALYYLINIHLTCITVQCSILYYHRYVAVLSCFATLKNIFKVTLLAEFVFILLFSFTQTVCKLLTCAEQVIVTLIHQKNDVRKHFEIQHCRWKITDTCKTAFTSTFP